MNLADAIRQSGAVSNLATWLADPDSTGVESMAFLDRSFARLSPAKQGRVVARIQSGDIAEVDSVTGELLIHEVCHLLRLEPDFEPDIGGLTPDLQLRAGGVAFVADVFVTNRPVSTLRRFGGLNGYVDRGEANKKIADAVASKAAKYNTSRMPLLVFVVFGGHDVDHHDLQTALYGSTVAEIQADGATSEAWHNSVGRHGLLCSPGRGTAHRNMSAVIGCDWFDTLKRDALGRRLHCLVFHHWDPHVAVAPGSFEPFGEIRWKSEPSRYVPIPSAHLNVVMKTDSNTEAVFGRYSADVPW
jgi:hypothetical protein